MLHPEFGWWLDPIIKSVAKRFFIDYDGSDLAVPQSYCAGTPDARPEPTEFYSGPFLIDGKNSRIFHGIQSSFPKVGAVEMEAGAVAQACSTQADREGLQAT